MSCIGLPVLYATIDATCEGCDKTFAGGAKIGFFEPQQKPDAGFGSALAEQLVHRVGHSLHECGTGGLGVVIGSLCWRRVEMIVWPGGW